MTQRAIVLAALAARPVRVLAPLRCDDSHHLIRVLTALGCGFAWEGETLLVSPRALQGTDAPLFCGNAGTAIRFASALSLVCEGPLVLDGNERMRQRPIGALGKALSAMGVAVEYPGSPHHPPLRLRRAGEPPARVAIDMSLSSQYASALLLVAPKLAQGLVVELTGELVSRPYLEMTVAMMRRAGARVTWNEERVIAVAPGSYFEEGQPEVVIEPDWSGAAFLLAAAFVTGLPLTVPGMPSPRESLQGDAIFSEFLQELQEPRDHVFNLADAPDLLSPLVVCALAASRPSRIVGVAHARAKESDRIHVLASELARLGFQIQEESEGLRVEPSERMRTGVNPEPPQGTLVLNSADDHRMAMAFGIVSLRVPGFDIADRGSVTKSFPGFFEQLERIRFAFLGENS